MRRLPSGRGRVSSCPRRIAVTDIDFVRIHMNDYRVYRPEDWSRRLLDHYFGTTSGDGHVVTSLLVTPEELARAVGAPEADAPNVRDVFVRALRPPKEGALFPDWIRSFAKSAQDEWAIVGAWTNTRPPFFAHLIFCCLAATESPDDVANEDSYRARLRELCGGALTEADFVALPWLWRYLVQWLSQTDPSTYRRLRLPPDNGYTLIGYTVRLAFPSRSDQVALGEVLADADCTGWEPPVGHVLAAVGESKSRFRKRFQEVYADFRSRYEKDQEAGSTLREHPFWAAVQDAARRGIGPASTEGVADAVQLFAQIDDRELIPVLVSTTRPEEGSGVVGRELDGSLGDYRWILEDPNEIGTDDATLPVVEEVLTRKRRYRGLDGLVQQGVVLFTQFELGTYIAVGNAGTSEVRHALVKEDLANAFAAQFETKGTPSVVEGWSTFMDVDVQHVAPRQLEGTALARVWSLQKGVPPTNIRLRGGIRIEGAWLGSKEVLPRVTAQGEGELWLVHQDGTEVALTAAGDGTWGFPPQDLSGAMRIVQRADGQDVDRLKLDFVSVPAVERFRQPTSLEALLCEGVGHAILLADALTVVPADESEWGLHADETILLGPDVGQFVDTPERSAWQVVCFAGKQRIRRGVLRGDDVLPRHQVEVDGLRRRWRKLLCIREVDATETGLPQARAAIRSAALKGDLPVVSAELDVGAVEGIVPATPAPHLARLVNVLVARLNARSGIPYREWFELLRSMVDAPHTDNLRSISRAWQEAGLIDVTSSMRWRSLMVYGRPPALELFRCGGGWGATLTGLALPSTTKKLSTIAKQHQVAFEERKGCCAWVPATPCFRAARRDDLAALANAERLPVRNASNEARLLDLATIGRATAWSDPPVNYADRMKVSPWRDDTEASEMVSMVRARRPDAPDCWEAAVGGRRVWSYDPNTVRLWSCRLAGLEPVHVEERAVFADRAFLPLPMARLLSTITGLRSGPSVQHAMRHLYPVHSPMTAAWIRKMLDSLFALD